MPFRQARRLHFGLRRWPRQDVRHFLRAPKAQEYAAMDTSIIVALIGLAGSIAVAVLTQKLSGKVKLQQREITWLKALIRLVVSDYRRA